jgi:hypothetical protein
MEITTTSSKMYSLIALFDLHTNYFRRVLEGIKDADAHNRLATKANHIAWLAGSLVSERYEMARTLGKEANASTNELFKNHKGIQDGITYPSLMEYKKDWEAITPILKEAFEKISDARLDSTIEMEGWKMKYFELLTFMTYREASIIGQIALWRRLLDYPGMKYD